MATKFESRHVFLLIYQLG